VLGGLLVAVAAVGIFAAYQDATDATTTAYVVAGRDLPAGTRIGESDVERVAVDLPTGLAARAFANVERLVGSVTLAPLAEGDLIQASGVVSGASREPARELSFAIDTERAVNGRLDPGERVDVLVTYGTGADAYTAVVVTGAEVVDVDEDSGGALGVSGGTVLTLALPDAEDALAVTHAVRAGEVTVVRTTLAGDAGNAGEGSTEYRPPASGADAPAQQAP
jgi:Flp pilus assembly protein CpaB